MNDRDHLSPNLAADQESTTQNYRSQLKEDYKATRRSTMSEQQTSFRKYMASQKEDERHTTSTKDKIQQRLLLKMGKQFGDDAETLKIISGVIRTHLKDGRKIKPEDIDSIEHEIFTRISNTNTNIALDVFHPRLVEKSNRKCMDLNHYGG